MDHQSETSFILKGNVCYSLSRTELFLKEGAYLVCENGKSAGVYEELPEQYRGFAVCDCGDSLIIPGMSDLHTHAPQYPIRACGMDKELMDWLDTYTFPEESRYADLSYADEAYGRFADDLRRTTTTRLVCFATLHREATELLMEKLEQTGLVSYVGLVEMDRNCPDFLRQPDAAAAIADTRQWLDETQGRFERTFPILTPRFAPSSTEEQLEALGRLRKEYGLPVQSHLSESPGEIAFVTELYPADPFYGAVYDRFGLFGGEGVPTIMAHCVYCSEEELALIRERGVYIAHCPDSNVNLSSGIAPARRYLDEGFRMGLGTDVAGGSTLNMLTTVADVIRSSKMRFRHEDASLPPLDLEAAFFLATIGGGSFFGKVGSFEEGCEFDAVVLDDTRFRTPRPVGLRTRLEKLCYLGGPQDVLHKYVAGRKLF